MSSKQNHEFNGKDAEYINDVPIMVRPQRQDVDLFRASDPAPSEVNPSTPMLVTIGGVILIVAVAIGIAFLVSHLLGASSSGFDQGKTYYILLKFFPNPDANKHCAQEGSTLELADGLQWTSKKAKGKDGLYLAIGKFRKGDEELVKRMMKLFEEKYPTSRVVGVSE